MKLQLGNALCWPIYIINLGDKTKLSCYTLINLCHVVQMSSCKFCLLYIIFWVGSCRPSPNKLICQQALLFVCCLRFVTFCASAGLAAVCPFLYLMISQVLEVSASLALGELILKESPKKS